MTHDPIGPRLMLAFEGFTPPPYLQAWIQERGISGFTLFRPYNVETPAQVRDLTAALQRCAAEANQPPLLFAADQEGGQLMAMGDHTTPFPGNMALGAAHDPDLARQVGAAIGRELAAMGVNVNYAPSCDINTNPANPNIGIRSFGDDPVLVGQMAAAMVEGLQSAGVAATLKHFPGIGDSSADSHYELPLIDHDRARLESVEFAPFKQAINAEPKMIMSGHFALPAITGNRDVPASLSHSVMTDLLRNQWGFDGVTITDALDMGAITQGAGQIVDMITAIRAGEDLLLMMPDQAVQQRAYEGLTLAYSRGLIDDTHLTPSLKRIAALQQWITAHPQPDLEVVGCAAHQQLAQQVAEKALTLVRDEDHLIPLRLNADTKIAAIMPQPIDLTPADTSSFVKPTLAAALRAYHPNVDEFITSHPPTDSEIAALTAQTSDYDLLVIGTISASMQPQQAELVNALISSGIPTITVALRTPYDLTVYPQSRTHLCTYSILEPSMNALARALWGEIPCEGRLPVQIAGLQVT